MAKGDFSKVLTWALCGNKEMLIFCSYIYVFSLIVLACTNITLYMNTSAISSLQLTELSWQRIGNRQTLATHREQTYSLGYLTLHN